MMLAGCPLGDSNTRPGIEVLNQFENAVHQLAGVRNHVLQNSCRSAWNPVKPVQRVPAHFESRIAYCAPMSMCVRGSPWIISVVGLLERGPFAQIPQIGVAPVPEVDRNVFLPHILVR